MKNMIQTIKCLIMVIVDVMILGKKEQNCL